MRDATVAAPKPLSMLTTVTPEALTRPPTALGGASSIPATTMMTLAEASRALRCMVATFGRTVKELS